MKRKGRIVIRALLAVTLLLRPAGSYAIIVDKIQNVIEHSELADILAEIKTFKASNIDQFVEELSKEIAQIEQLITVSQNTYNSVKGITEANSFLDAVYSGATLLGNNNITGQSKPFMDMARACSAAMSEYQTYLNACQYFATMDRNFDFNAACDRMRMLSGFLQNSFDNVDTVIKIIQKYPTDAMRVKQALEEQEKEADYIAAQIDAEIDALMEEQLYKMQGEILANGISNYPETFQVRTIGTDGGKPTKTMPRSGGALKYGGIQSKNNNAGGIENEPVTPYDEKNAREMFKAAAPVVLDIASVTTLILAILFTARNYARKHSGEHGSDNALLKTMVGAFIIIAIIQIVRALIVKL